MLHHRVTNIRATAIMATATTPGCHHDCPYPYFYHSHFNGYMQLKLSCGNGPRFARASRPTINNPSPPAGHGQYTTNLERSKYYAINFKTPSQVHGCMCTWRRLQQLPASQSL